jgi:hypothetical protein
MYIHAHCNPFQQQVFPICKEHCALHAKISLYLKGALAAGSNWHNPVERRICTIDVVIAIYAPMIFAAPSVRYVMFLMRADPLRLRGQVGGGWALEIETFLGPEMATSKASAILAQKSRSARCHFKGPKKVSVSSSVADGCLSRIRLFFYPGSTSKNLSILTPKKMFFKLAEI